MGISDFDPDAHSLDICGMGDYLTLVFQNSQSANGPKQRLNIADQLQVVRGGSRFPCD